MAFSQASKPMPALGQLPLGVFVAVDAQPGVIRKVGTKLDEERAELLVHAVEVVMVDHRGGLHQPGIGFPGCGAAAFERAVDGGLLLSFADHDHPLVAVEPLEMLVKDVFLADALLEGDERQTLLRGEPFDGGDEGPRHAGHHQGRGARFAPVLAEEHRDAAAGLQHGLVDVQIHAVDAFQVETDVLPDDIGDSVRYTHAAGSDSPRFCREPPPQRGTSLVHRTSRMDRSLFVQCRAEKHAPLV
jgi:hypothetical protein